MRWSTLSNHSEPDIHHNIIINTPSHIHTLYTCNNNTHQTIILTTNNSRNNLQHPITIYLHLAHHAPNPSHRTVRRARRVRGVGVGGPRLYTLLHSGPSTPSCPVLCASGAIQLNSALLAPGIQLDTVSRAAPESGSEQSRGCVEI
jgi:hypothetical protein